MCDLGHHRVCWRAWERAGGKPVAAWGYPLPLFMHGCFAILLGQPSARPCKIEEVTRAPMPNAGTAVSGRDCPMLLGRRACGAAGRAE